MNNIPAIPETWVPFCGQGWDLGSGTMSSSNRFTCYDSFEQYRQRFSDHQIYLFMLDGKINLKDLKKRPRKTPFSLVFGNEGSGLPEIFHHYGDSIYIEHNHEIDSLNLSVAFGIAANAFSGSFSRLF